MKKYVFLPIIFSIIIFGCKTSSSENMDNQIREPAVAGAFYSSNPANLKAQIKSFYESAKNIQLKGNLIGLIVPHAGYEYSGQVAANSYIQLKNKKIDNAIIIGSSHRYALGAPSIYLAGKYKTPLGEVRVNKELAARIKDKLPFMAFNKEAHRQEHTIEVQIPFLQVLLGNNFQIVPILTGPINNDLLTEVPDMLYELLNKEENLIIIASTDLSHYPIQEKSSKVDNETINLIKAEQTLKLIEREQNVRNSGVANLVTYQCGLGPVAILIETAKKFPKRNLTLLDYKNSGDVSWVKERCVGYASIALTVK